MFPALNMELEIVRTVLKNPVNDIYVCTDLRKNTGTFYTMVSIADPDCRRKVTEKLNTERLFFSNRDFIGSFIYENRLNLVFRYYHENLLSLLGGVYLVEFADCKRAALGLIAACAECGAGADMGVLLLNDRNINITREGEVQFNYFLDFSQWQPGIEEQRYYQEVTQKVFGILELNYKGKYETPDSYPGDIRLFYMKMTTTGFPSLGHMISAVRNMPDQAGGDARTSLVVQKSFSKSTRLFVPQCHDCIFNHPCGGDSHLCGSSDPWQMEGQKSVRKQYQL